MEPKGYVPQCPVVSDAITYNDEVLSLSAASVDDADHLDWQLDLPGFTPD